MQRRIHRLGSVRSWESHFWGFAGSRLILWRRSQWRSSEHGSADRSGRGSYQVDVILRLDNSSVFHHLRSRYLRLKGIWERGFLRTTFHEFCETEVGLRRSSWKSRELSRRIVSLTTRSIGSKIVYARIWCETAMVSKLLVQLRVRQFVKWKRILVVRRKI